MEDYSYDHSNESELSHTTLLDYLNGIVDRTSVMR